MVSLAWNPADMPVIAVLLTATVAYAAYYYFADERAWRRRPGGGGPDGQVRAVVRQRVSGFALLGLLPALLAFWLPGGLPSLGLQFGGPGTTLVWVLAAAAVILPFLRLGARKPERWAHYPQMRRAVWDRRLWLTNVLSWGLYLLGYEFCFRGFLLMPLADAYGAWPAIAISTALYVLAHLHKEAAETFACILMGVLFAVMALHTGAIWAPFLLHWLIAVSSETFALQANPGMRWASGTDAGPQA